MHPTRWPNKHGRCTNVDQGLLLQKIQEYLGQAFPYPRPSKVILIAIQKQQTVETPHNAGSLTAKVADVKALGMILAPALCKVHSI